MTAASVKAVSDTYLGHPPAIGTSLRYALRRLLAVLGCEMLRVLGLIVAFIALIVPGIWLYGRWSVAHARAADRAHRAGVGARGAPPAGQGALVADGRGADRVGVMVAIVGGRCRRC